MPTSVMPPTRSMAALAGENIYPSADSPINLERFLTNAVPAGSRGRIVAQGNKLYESGNMSKPIKLHGNSMAFTLPYFDKALAAEAARKYRAKGMDWMRVHGLENYLMVGGAMGSLGTPITQTRAYSAQRWDEFDYYFAEFKKAGIYFSFGIMSYNLAVAVGNTTNRFTSVANTSGTITVTIFGGKIIAATQTGATGYFFPPSVYVNGAGGVGARLACSMDANGNVLPNLTVLDGGEGYGPDGTNTTIAKFVGGNGNYKERILFDDRVRAEYAQLLYDILNHVNPYTGLAYKDDPAVWMVESYNESTIASYDQMPVSTYPLFQKWLKDRYGDILTLNNRWGNGVAGYTNFGSFADPALLPIAAINGAGGTNNATRWRKSDTGYWRSELDINQFKFYIKAARDAGWTGLTAGPDLYANPAVMRTQALCGADIQNMHAYLSLQDAVQTGKVITTGAVPNNNSVSFNPAGIMNCLTWANPDQPMVFTEIGSPAPNRYRAEAGMFYAALLSTYGVSGMAWHADAPYALKWGGSDINRFRCMGLYPLSYEHCPSTLAGQMHGTIAYLRGDFDEAPVTRVLETNDRAFSYYLNYNDVPGVAPFYDFRQFDVPIEHRLIPMLARCQHRHIPLSGDNTIDNNRATAWQNSLSRSATLQIQNAPASGGIGAPSTNETYNWVITKANNSVANEFIFNAVMYPISGGYFYDSVAGVGGVNRPKVQSAIIYNQLARKSGSLNRKGKGFYANDFTAANKPIRSLSFRKNFLDRTHWTNLDINYADDGVFIGISSYDNVPIANATRLYVNVAGRFYNTGATWQSAGKKITAVSFNPATAAGVNYTSVPTIALSGNGGGDSAGTGFTAVCKLSGGTSGTLTSVEVLEEGWNYLPTVTATISGGGQAANAVPVTLTFDDDDPQKEIKILQSWATDGNEGWPIRQQNIVADFNVVGIDVNRPWVLHEYDYAGNRVATYPAEYVPARTVDGIARPAGVHLLIESIKLAKPSVYFMLEQAAAVARKQRL